MKSAKISETEAESSVSNISASDVTHHAQIFSPDSNLIYLSIVLNGGKVGAAYYEADTQIVHFLEATVEASPFERIQALIEELRPAVVVTSAKQDPEFVEKLKEFTKYAAPDKDSSTDSPTEPNTRESCVEIMSSMEFRFETSKRRILLLKIPSVPDHYSDMERALHISTLVQFENTCSIRATGALLRYLDKNRIGVGLESPNVQTPVLAIRTFTLKHAMLMDGASYDALQIFKQIRHPSAYKIGYREGISLFGILNRTSTLVGRKMLRSWFYRPTTDLSVLNERLNAVSYLIDPRNEEILKIIKNCLKNVKNVSKIFLKLKTSKLAVTDWIGLWETAQNALRIADCCRNALTKSQRDVPSIFSDIVLTFTGELVAVVELISNTVDLEGSKAEKKLMVNSGVSGLLDDMRTTYAKLPGVLGQLAEEELERYGGYISSCQVVYMRLVGYLLFITKTERMRETGELELPEADLMGECNDTVYYKTPATKQLDSRFGDILEETSDTEARIINQLQDAMMRYAPVLVDVMQFTAQLDCLVSFAIAAKEFNYIRPILSTSGAINITRSRHPLQEHTTAMFVPNDVIFEPGKGEVKVLTGPNASGKSVYLKQAGLLVYMAQIGSYVPAERAEIGLVEKIFTRIKSRESVSCGLSTFAKDLGQISTAVHSATPRSLVLIDEFGKGTATVDGLALLASVLSYWVSMPGGSPKVICATHFHKLAHLLPTSPAVSYVTMDTMSEGVCLYQMKGGMCGRSDACTVALGARIPTEIVSRGEEVSELIRGNSPITPFNRSSTLSTHCHQVALSALHTNLDNPASVDRMLYDVIKLLGSPDRKHPTNCDVIRSSDETQPTETSA